MKTKIYLDMNIVQFSDGNEVDGNLHIKGHFIAGQEWADFIRDLSVTIDSATRATTDKMSGAPRHGVQGGSDGSH
jgi:hypothetical protein